MYKEHWDIKSQCRNNKINGLPTKSYLMSNYIEELLQSNVNQLNKNNSFISYLYNFVKKRE